MRERVGVVPMAGSATRIAPLPCSKELLPVGFLQGEDGTPRPRPVSRDLLDRMRLGGARRAVLVLREGKWDIPAYYGSGESVGMDLAYVVARHLHGVPFSVDAAYPLVREATVLFGFPDILLRPGDLFGPTAARLEGEDADVVLALFPHGPPEQMDQVRVDGEGRVLRLAPRPNPAPLDHTWTVAAWGPRFTEFLRGYVERAVREGRLRAEDGRERSAGHAVQAAVEAGLRVEGVAFPEGRYLDIGTPGDLVRALSEEWT